MFYLFLYGISKIIWQIVKIQDKKLKIKLKMKTETKYTISNIRESSGMVFKKGTLIADFFNKENQYKGTYPLSRLIN